MEVTTDPLTGVFEADRTHSSFQFAVRHMKVSTFRASFGDVDARLIADEGQLRLEGAARVESISIADPPVFREHVVRGADFFDADRHPEILFRSERVEPGRERNGDGRGRADDQGHQPADHGHGNIRAAGRGSVRLPARGARSASRPRPARLGADLAAAASRRRRRARLGRRADGPARARPTALAMRLEAVNGSLRQGSFA